MHMFCTVCLLVFCLVSAPLSAAPGRSRPETIRQSHIAHDIDKFERDDARGGQVFSAPYRAKLLDAADRYFDKTAIRFHESNRACALNCAAFEQAVRKTINALDNPQTSAVERLQVERFWALLDFAIKRVPMLVAADAPSDRMTLVVAMRVSYAVAQMESSGAQSFSSRFVHALESGNSIDESLRSASDGRYDAATLLGARRAARVLPADGVSRLNDATVYVEFANGALVYSSNFENATDPANDGLVLHARKIRVPTAEASDPGTAFSRFLPADDARKEGARKIFEEDATLLVDISVFDQAGVPRLDLSRVHNIRLVDGERGTTYDAKPEIMTTRQPPPSLIATVKGCCLYGRPPHLAANLSRTLSKQPFDPAQVRFASMFIESATEKEVEHSSRVRAARVAGDAKSLMSLQDLQKLVASASGKTLVLIGHVEDDQYVVRTSSNAEQLRVPIAVVRAMAKANNVRLIDIGCQSARVIAAESFGLGVMTDYNSVEAIRSIERALASAGTMEQFMLGIASEGLKIVIEPSFADTMTIKAGIFSRVRSFGRSLWLQVAQVVIAGA